MLRPHVVLEPLLGVVVGLGPRSWWCPSGKIASQPWSRTFLLPSWQCGVQCACPADWGSEELKPGGSQYSIQQFLALVRLSAGGQKCSQTVMDVFMMKLVRAHWPMWWLILNQLNLLSAIIVSSFALMYDETHFMALHSPLLVKARSNQIFRKHACLNGHYTRALPRFCSIMPTPPSFLTANPLPPPPH